MDDMLNERTITIRKSNTDGFEHYYILINGIHGLNGPILSCVRYNPNDVFEVLSTLTVRYGTCKVIYETED